MSVVIAARNAESAPRPVPKTVINIAFWVFTVAYVICAVFAVLDLIVAITVLVGGTTEKSAFIINLQGMVMFALYALILFQLRSLSADLRAEATVDFARHGRRLACVAYLFLGLFAAALVFTLLLPALSHGTYTYVGVNFALPGFPQSSLWREALGDMPYLDDPHQIYASLDLGSLVSACIFWSLSHVFRYCAWLQRENAMTV